MKNVASHFSYCEADGRTYCAARAVSVIATSITTENNHTIVHSEMLKSVPEGKGTWPVALALAPPGALYA